MSTSQALVDASTPVLTGTVVQANAVGDWFNEHSDKFISGLINAAILLVVAVVLRAIAGRVIDQITKRMIRSHERLQSTKTKAKTLAPRKNGPAVVEPANEEVRAERQRQRASTIGAMLKSVASAIIFAVTFITILGQIGINITPILTSAGVLGLAVAFGAQSLVQDYLSGLFMMAEDQYGIGDVVDVGEAVGTVEAVTLRTTRIRDINGGLWHIRNGEIMRVNNMNQDWAHVVVELPLDYTVDLDEAKRVIQDTIDAFAAEPDVETKLLEPPTIDGVTGIGNGAVNLRILAKTRPGQQWSLGRELRGQLKYALDQNGIRIAQPVLPMDGTGATKAG